jgi:hypothetical protein
MDEMSTHAVNATAKKSEALKNVPIAGTKRRSTTNRPGVTFIMPSEIDIAGKNSNQRDPSNKGMLALRSIRSPTNRSPADIFEVS